eukprot:1844673-Rhodomonas_salina.1
MSQQFLLWTLPSGAVITVLISGWSRAGVEVVPLCPPPRTPRLILSDQNLDFVLRSRGSEQYYSVMGDGLLALPSNCTSLNP